MGDVERRVDSIDGDGHEIRLRAVDDGHARGIYERAIKPVLDRFVGIVLTVLSVPIIIVVGTLIAVSMGRPVIFRQRRVGRFGREITVFKFRTMGEDRRDSSTPIEHPERRINHKSNDDPRHTDIGRFLRKWSLDEVPQFWNIALGHMSLVGPRPELPSIAERYEPWQHRRHEVKPGLTGLWQISARGDRPMHDATDLDIAYVDDLTFAGDMRILLHTPGAVLGARRGS